MKAPGSPGVYARQSSYRPEVDGLRAVAVLPVILFHAGVVSFSGGYIGVDVFFVISGFLIGRILLDEISAGRFSLIAFYERRARRILPALFLVALVSAPFAWVWAPAHLFELFSKSLIAVAIFAANILFYREADYFAPAADENVLLHTWSLGVEEQFYLVFPIILLLLLPRGRVLTLAVVTLIVVARPNQMAYGARNQPDARWMRP